MLRTPEAWKWSERSALLCARVCKLQCTGLSGQLVVCLQVALLSPYIQREVLRCGHGFAEDNPVVLPKQVTPVEAVPTSTLHTCTCFH